MSETKMPRQISLQKALQNETKKFEEYYQWLEKAMPSSFFEEVSSENILLITHNLMGFDLQEYFSPIHLKGGAIVLCLDSPNADLSILKNYSLYGIKSYITYLSNLPLPFKGVKAPLRIATLTFTEAIESPEKALSSETLGHLHQMIREKEPSITPEEFSRLLEGIGERFLRALPVDRQVLALELCHRARSRDKCQYEVRYNQNWEEERSASMQIVMAWRNTPKYNFLFRLARTINRHGLTMKRVNATYVDPYSKNPIFVMVLTIHGSDGRAIWDVADIPEFLRDLVTFKYFPNIDQIEDVFVSKKIITGCMGNLLRAMINFIHQNLVRIDVNLYTVENIEEGLCRHPELTLQLLEAFKFRFDPAFHDSQKYEMVRSQFLIDVNKLDTGQEENDKRRKNVLLQAMNMVDHTLKTNFYRSNYTSISFRLDPQYLNAVPYDRTKDFPELPYAVFYIKGMNFFGFHIRFKDLARGGLRTVFPEQSESLTAERNTIFAECYNLAYTQHMKNKDIPEGGAKGIIFLRPYDKLDSEILILEKELRISEIEDTEIETRLGIYHKEQMVEFLYQAQRSFIESLIALVNCEPDGTIRARHIIDYWKRPEYLYLGPDENMHDVMIQWIADFSEKYHYKPGSSFISSKPKVGINHKEYGVTSLGVNVYMDAILRFMGIDPEKEPFSLKMSGGPDGDVAGNQICNLYRYYPATAKLLALTDVTGTIHDPKGLDLKILADLFHARKGIRFYPPEKLNEGGLLVDKHSIRKETEFVQQTLCWRKIHGKLIEDWISGSDMNYLLRSNVHQTVTDIFIPSGGRPRSLNEGNIRDFLDETGRPTARAIIEGANLYLDDSARRFLEKLGVLIIKDSSANKTGVICSSFEVLSGLTLGDKKFMLNKHQLVKEILARLKLCALNEANLLIRTHQETGDFLTDISDKISRRINQFTYQILDYLDPLPLSNNPNDPLIQCFLNYCLPTLKGDYQADLIREIPSHHQKAIIACSIAARLVYQKGLSWFPSVVDILPMVLQDGNFENSTQ